MLAIGRVQQVESVKQPVGGSQSVPALRIATCMLVSASEGFDLASVGLTGPSLSKAFDLNGIEFGLTATALMAGFFLGASAGGALGDRYGRKRALLLSLTIVMLASFYTTSARAFLSLLAARLLMGLGVGGVFPNMLAIAAESVPLSIRARAVTLTNCGGSLGAICAALLLAIGGEAMSWWHFFLVSAMAPIPIALAAWLFLPESVRRDSVRSTEQAVAVVLFGGGRGTRTLLLWLANVLTAFVYYMVGNWSPTLLAQRGLAPSAIGAAQMMLSFFAMVGALGLATWLDRGKRRLAIVVAYGGMLLALPAFSLVYSVPAVMLSMMLLGLTVFSGQLLLYALAPLYYPGAYRATGLGAAVAAGRIGAVLSPWVVGALLDAGIGQRNLILSVLPLVFVAGLGAYLVAARAPERT